MNSCRHCGRKGRFYRDEPSGYLAWHAWAERMSRTHHQEQCPGCLRFSIWRLGVDDELLYEETAPAPAAFSGTGEKNT